MSALLELIAGIFDLVTGLFLVKQRNRELSRRLAETENKCLHCGGEFPAKAGACPICGWSFRSADAEEP